MFGSLEIAEHRLSNYRRAASWAAGSIGVEQALPGELSLNLSGGAVSGNTLTGIEAAGRGVPGALTGCDR